MLSPIHVDAPYRVIIIEEQEHHVRKLAELKNAESIDQ